MTDSRPASQVTDLQTVLTTCFQQESLWQDRQTLRVVVAYSGGVDSTALLHALSRLAERDLTEASPRLKLAAAFYHHAWRGTPAPELARLHKNVTSYHVPLVLLPPEPNEQKTEAVARANRYRKLRQFASSWQADVIVTAHHEEDQVETVLFRLLRGTGLDGLQGIKPRLDGPLLEDEPLAGESLDESGSSLPVPVLRPFLKQSKASLQAYIDAHQLKTFADPTNDELQYARNALRHKVLPLIREVFPQATHSLLELNTRIKDDLAIVHDVTNRQWHEWKVTSVPLTFDLSGFSQVERAYQLRFAKRLLQELGLSAAIAPIHRLADFISGESTALHGNPLFSVGLDPDTGRERFLMREKNRLQLVMKPDPQKPMEPVTLTSGLPVALPNSPGAWLGLQHLEELSHSLTQETSPVVYGTFDRLLGMSLEVRHRRPGDWVKPIGLGGSRRLLKRLFIDRGVPRFDRDAWPVVAIQGSSEVVWVPQVVLSERLRIDSPEQSAYLFAYFPEGEWESLLSKELLPQKKRLGAADEEEDTSDTEQPSSEMDASELEELVS